MTMKHCLWLLLALGAAVIHAAPVAAPDSPVAAKADPFAKWEAEIAAIEAAEKVQPPPQGGILFIGSSTIRLWHSLAADFPGQPVVNHGFGGSQIVDATHFAPRLVFPCAPKVIVLRAGGNDIHAGKTPQQVFADYQDFVAAVHARLPRTRIIYLGLCPTIARHSEIARGDALNAAIRDHAAGHPLLDYVACADMTVDAAGHPRPELFQPDGLHLSAAGYQLLAARTRPFLPPPTPAPAH